MDLAKRQELRWASGGIGTSQHLAGELFTQMSGLKMVHVPYRGTGPALNDLAAGIVDAYFGDPATLGLINGGKARAMAVTSPERWPRAARHAGDRRGACRATRRRTGTAIAAPPKTPEPVMARADRRDPEGHGRPGGEGASTTRPGCIPRPCRAPTTSPSCSATSRPGATSSPRATSRSTTTDVRSPGRRYRRHVHRRRAGNAATAPIPSRC